MDTSALAWGRRVCCPCQDYHVSLPWDQRQTMPLHEQVLVKFIPGIPHVEGIDGWITSSFKRQNHCWADFYVLIHRSVSWIFDRIRHWIAWRYRFRYTEDNDAMIDDLWRISCYSVSVCWGWYDIMLWSRSSGRIGLWRLVYWSINPSCWTTCWICRSIPQLKSCGHGAFGTNLRWSASSSTAGLHRLMAKHTTPHGWWIWSL